MIRRASDPIDFAEYASARGKRKQEQPLITITFFPDKSATRKGESTLSLMELAEKIQRSTAQSKAVLPWLKLARFGDVRTRLGSLRHDENVLACTGVEVDYDNEEIPFHSAVETIRRADLQAVLYTSPSHTIHKPRWRVLCPTSTDLPPDQREQLVGRLNGLFHGMLADESFTLSQAYYYGSVARNPEHQVEVVDGIPIDLAETLDTRWIGKKQTKPSGVVDEHALKQAITSGQSYHQPSLRLIGLWVRKGCQETDTESRLRDLFNKVTPSKRDRRWEDRLNDMPRWVRDIYLKEQAKTDQKGKDGADVDLGIWSAGEDQDNIEPRQWLLGNPALPVRAERCCWRWRSWEKRPDHCGRTRPC
jgi:hypothetical protein